MLWLLLGLFAVGASAAPSPFDVMAFEAERDGAPHVVVLFRIPTAHYLYAESVEIEIQPPATLVQAPTPHSMFDPHLEKEVEVYDRDHEWWFRRDELEGPVEVVVRFQGCNRSACFFPDERRFRLGVVEEEATAAPETPAEPSWREIADRFEVKGRAAGYLPVGQFLSFLDDAEAAGGAGERRLTGWMGILLILVGGLSLNLTPCVLPLIPVNLALIGAGAKAGSKRRGLALGATYGLGMALAYGALGLLVILTRAPFGAVNASPWFNGFIAALFFVLALAMFGVFEIDLSRFQKPGSLRVPKAPFVAAFFLGALSAMLAGACVAPVLISVLLWASTLYAQGKVAGLLLPFLLGVGMALPWPLAGAGLAILPKPGRWMIGVRVALGLFILGLGAYYARIAWRLVQPAPTTAMEHIVDTPEGFARSLRAAHEARQPVFVDFWATWCKNCFAMEKTTFVDPRVRERLSKYRIIKYQAEHPNEPPNAEVLEHYGVWGLPTYLVLRPL